MTHFFEFIRLKNRVLEILMRQPWGACPIARIIFFAILFVVEHHFAVAVPSFRFCATMEHTQLIGAGLCQSNH